MNEVRQGIVSGDSNQDIVSRVMGTREFDFKDGVLDKSRNNVAAITRTAVTDVSERAREVTFQQNSQVMKGVQYVATLDNRTTIICASLDKNVYPIGKGPRPPQHFNCRSVTVPQTKSWREMGIDRDEISPSTRASMDGQVPADKSFSEYLKDPNSSLDPEEMLGKTRAKLWRKGDLDLNDFLRGGVKNKNVMNLDELRQRHGEAFGAIQ